MKDKSPRSCPPERDVIEAPVWFRLCFTLVLLPARATAMGNAKGTPSAFLSLLSSPFDLSRCIERAVEHVSQSSTWKHSAIQYNATRLQRTFCSPVSLTSLRGPSFINFPHTWNVCALIYQGATSRRAIIHRDLFIDAPSPIELG